MSNIRLQQCLEIDTRRFYTVETTEGFETQTDMHTHRRLKKETDHFNGCQDGLLNKITVGRCTAWVQGGEFTLA